MWAIIQRDISLAFAQGGGLLLTVAFFLILVVFVPFGIGPAPTLLSKIAPGMLWIGALLATLLSLDRIFQLDFEDGTLDALATAPIPLTGLVTAKALAHWITTGLPLTLAALPLGFLLFLPNGQYMWLFLSLLIGTPALSFIGTFGAALTLSIKRGGLLLSLLVLPLFVPTLLFGVQAIIHPDHTIMLALLAVISLLSAAVLPFVTALALRAGLR
ncbi:MAG: heme exporter protein CcmB [Pseudomonadota bacterium]